MSVRLLYGFDPLCGWCYGFSPALRHVRTQFPSLPVELRMGGLVTGDRIRPYAESAGYITAASVRLAAVTGVEIGPSFHAGILSDPSVTASSIPPCDVLLQVRSRYPASVLDFADAIQGAHFGSGRDLNVASTYAEITQRLGLDIVPAIPAPSHVRPALAAEFAQGRALGLTSYPSLLLERDRRMEPVDITYVPEEMATRIGAMLERR